MPFNKNERKIDPSVPTSVESVFKRMRVIYSEALGGTHREAPLVLVEPDE
jgi:hypothetical protein